MYRVQITFMHGTSCVIRCLEVVAAFTLSVVVAAEQAWLVQTEWHMIARRRYL